ncbi:MAG: hypothetical protein U0457_04000 [Candidatus Sericytochromatia bacterium]
MYAKKTDYGLEITLKDKMTMEQTKESGIQIEAIMMEYKKQNKKFSILVNLTEVQRQSPEVMQEIGRGMSLSKELGSDRVSVIFNSSVAKLQMANKARESGVYSTERHFSIT